MRRDFVIFFCLIVVERSEPIDLKFGTMRGLAPNEIIESFIVIAYVVF